MINSLPTVDPVIKDLNLYLFEQEQHDIKQEYFQAKAESEFQALSYTEIVVYQDNYRDLETLFEFVLSGQIAEAQATLNKFFTTVKDTYIENRMVELEQEEQQERENDEAMERYYLAKDHSDWC